MHRDIHTALALLEGGFSQFKILVIGDLMLDRYIVGDVERISPEAPVPVLLYAERYQRAGGAANVAVNLAGIGCKALLAGFWGSDTECDELRAILREAGVNTDAVVSTKQSTISKTRIVGRSQQLLRLDIESREPPSDFETASLQESAVALIETMHAVILSDDAKGALTLELCEAVIRAARRCGVPVFVDPKTPDFSRYSGATMVCPNLNELSIATGMPKHMLEPLLERGEELRKDHELKHLAITMSENGIRVLSADGVYNSPARAREVFDVSGAGDTVIATLAASLAGGLPLESAVDLANLAAGIVVGKVGTVPITHNDLVAALTPSTGITMDEKILDRTRVAQRVAEWRASGETVVFTNGCFDLLHVGHVTLLEDCRRFGSKLVLGLNTDASVSRLKGPTRPIVSQNDRARVISALASVDAVTLFDEETPLAIIEALRPDVLVKGGDYSVDSVVGHEFVIGHGGRVEIVPTVKGFSTTNLVRSISGQSQPD